MKPFRAHHCSKCDACILKMDHHCPYDFSLWAISRWINNCVGARNQKFFVLFLIYVHMGEMLASVLGGWQVYSHFAFIRVVTWYWIFIYSVILILYTFVDSILLIDICLIGCSIIWSFQFSMRELFHMYSCLSKWLYHLSLPFSWFFFFMTRCAQFVMIWHMWNISNNIISKQQK